MRYSLRTGLIIIYFYHFDTMSSLLPPTSRYNKSSVSSANTRISDSESDEHTVHKAMPRFNNIDKSLFLDRPRPRHQPGQNLLEVDGFKGPNSQSKRCQKSKQKAAHSDHEDCNRDTKQKYKTELCKNFEVTGRCKFGKTCLFAHGANEVQHKAYAGLLYKTKMCDKFFNHGYCPYGNRCLYKHSVSQQGTLSTFCEKLLGSLQNYPSIDLAQLISQQQSK